MSEAPRTQLRFRPGIVPTAFMVFGVVTTVSLGVWQLTRHWEKQSLKEEILQGLDQPPATQADLGAEVTSLHYRKVAVEGEWGEPQVLMAGRTPLVSDSVMMPKAGYGIVQPLILDDGTRLVVDRGWVPRDDTVAILDDIDAPGERVRLTGQIRPLEGKNTSGPTPGREGYPEIWPPGSWPMIWSRVDGPKVEAIVLAGEPLLAGEGARPDIFPIGGYKPLPKMRDSLSYAFQWWLFGTVLTGVWLALGFARGREAAETPATGASDPA